MKKSWPYAFNKWFWKDFFLWVEVREGILLVRLYIWLKIRVLEKSAWKSQFKFMLTQGKIYGIQDSRIPGIWTHVGLWHRKVSLKGFHSLNYGLYQKSFGCISLPYTLLKKRMDKHFFIRTIVRELLVVSCVQDPWNANFDHFYKKIPFFFQ